MGILTASNVRRDENRRGSVEDVDVYDSSAVSNSQPDRSVIDLPMVVDLP